MPSRPITENPILKSKPLIISIIGIATAVIICTVIYILYSFWQTLFQRSRTSPFEETPPQNLQKFSYKEIKSATNAFNEENSIGKGGSGAVFRGVLKDGKSVAVKKLDPSSSSSSSILQAEREFQNELNIMGMIKSPSPNLVSLLGYCIHKSKRILVYEYMPNKSLQELMFSDGDSNLVSWERRFQIILDVCKAIEFLHNECDPPVIHGDVKPSNVLLDWDFRAKLSDFGLSRLKLEGGDHFGVEMFSQELGPETPPSGARTPVLAKESIHRNVVQKGECSTSSYSPSSKQWGKDWWWKQDGSGELCSKDYVMEWIGSQIDSEVIDSDNKQEQEQEQEQTPTPTIKSVSKKEPKRMEDWWKEENLEEMNNKKKGMRRLKRKIHLCISTRRRKSTRANQGPETGSRRRIWRLKKKTCSLNSEVWSGELLSSTTSMRGTLCYVAPEFGGTCFGFLMEKTDIYSLGVLILVVVSGRRPLHVLNSPMKLEKANLVSWCRQLAQSGSVLELVDEKLKGGYNKEQATLCINLALGCLNRMPELRPDIGDIVRILKGEIDLPLLPLELSPSPPCKLSSKMRSKT